MAAVVNAPDAAKAVTTAPGGELMRFSFPIDKSRTRDTDVINPVDGTPDVEIAGKCTDGTLDSDLQIVDPQASLRWIEAWSQKGNIRFQHDSRRPVGKGFQVDGHFIQATISDPLAKHFIRTGVLNDFSIGIANPDIRVGDPAFRHLDPAGKAVGGIITDRPDGSTNVAEISICDRGSNFSTKFAIAKAAADGTGVWVGEMTAPEELLATVPAARKRKTVTVELPKNMSLSVKPSDLAKLMNLRHGLERQRAEAAKSAAAPEVIHKAAVPPAGPEPDAALKAVMTAESAIWKRDIDTATRRRLAGEGRALPDLSYPIETHEDAGNAVTLAMSGHGDAPAAKKLIRRIARKEGWQDILDRLRGGGKPKAGKAAASEPEVTKCPCGEDGCSGCKKGRKMARRMAAKLAAGPPVAKKARVTCGGCGAMQSRKHNNCTECGKPLAGAVPVTKNHDHMCLGCGKAPLDKGERHCPGCGRENPGYLPEADRKIPANKTADSGKDRVPGASEDVTKRRKGGKGKKGGKLAPPFGAKDDEPDEGDGKKAAPKAEKRRKGRGKGRSPAAGVEGQHTAPLPPHREPDGAPVEMFEHDAHLEDGDEGEEMRAAMRHKSLEARGLSAADAVLHDLTCPAFSPDVLARALPYSSLAGLDETAWQHKALSMAATAPLDQARDAMGLWQHAMTLKGTVPDLAREIGEERHAAFRKVNKRVLGKSFTDAVPGPGHAPTPGHITPGQFRRPILDAGHSAPSPGHDAPRHFPVPEGQPSAEDYTRQFLSAGHAADAPQNDSPRHEPIPAPEVPGRPGRVYYTQAMRDNARQAMTAMHDHIARIFPDVCPLASPPPGETQKPAPQVPEGVGGPAPRASKSGRKAEKKRTRKAAARKMAGKRRKTAVKAARATALPLAPADPASLLRAPVPTPLEPDALKAAIADAIAGATAPLALALAKTQRASQRERDRTRKALKRQAKNLDAIAGQPDTSAAPFRGVAAVKSMAPAAPAPVTATQAAEQYVLADLQHLHWVAKNSSDPGQREAARREIDQRLTPSMTTHQT